MPDPGTIMAAVGSGVKAFADVVKVYQDLNPPQSGQVSVVNDTKDTVTVRSYNNNDWAKLIAAAQITLKPGAAAMITAATDPVQLVWKRGNYGALKPFGTENLSQSSAPKGDGKVFVITEKNTL